MKAKLLSASVAMALALTATAASAVDFHGYVRSGVGVSQDGSTQSWMIPYVGRLGNEADTYGEIQLDQELYNKAGVTFGLSSMVCMSSGQGRGWESTSNGDADFACVSSTCRPRGCSRAIRMPWYGRASVTTNAMICTS